VIPPFPPQLFILLGIDIFLGGSILTVLLDEYFPTALPYVMEIGALFGFIQLVLVPQYITGYPSELQFFYSAAYAVIAVLSILASNVYIAFLKGKTTIAGIFTIVASIPCVLVVASFSSAYFNGVVLTLPALPLMPMSVIYGALFGATGLIVAAMVAIAYVKQRVPEQNA
jgi:hypothetical protein